MRRRAALLALLAGAITFATLDLGQAQSSAPASATQLYRPSLADLMTAAIQPRHIKLGLAGREKNWPLAAYQLGNLKGAFSRTAQAWPTYRTTDMAGLIEATTKGPMEAMTAAIKTGNSDRFNEAYGQLTETCNACHQSTDHALVVIRAPKESPFPDQEFRPARP